MIFYVIQQFSQSGLFNLQPDKRKQNKVKINLDDPGQK